MNAPRPDAFADFLGAKITQLGGGNATAELTFGPQHLNPHGTGHGSCIYALAGLALAAAANNDTHSGVVSAVQIDYLAPVREGDTLVAHAAVQERLTREDIFVIRVLRGADPGEVVARATGRANRRARA
jgi:acyl-CoA thioesterase